MAESRKSLLRSRLPLIAVLLLGAAVWKTGAFGFLATDRTVVLRLPASYGEVRSADVQVWDEQQLLKREVMQLPTGLNDDLRTTVALSRGHHRAICALTMRDATTKSWLVEFEAGNEPTLVLTASSGTTR